MKQINSNPTAHITINKSRIKKYNKKSDTPTYYLEKGQEFQIELFNPTTDTILAKIHLNDTAISQGGLVLRPGERIFLERYLDVEKKFKFDTYEVANTQEVKKAIEDNGDFKVEFYREVKARPRPILFGGTVTTYNHSTYTDIFGGTLNDARTGSLGITPTTFTSNVGNDNIGGSSANLGATASGEVTLDFLGMDHLKDGVDLVGPSSPLRSNSTRKLKSKKTTEKSIETGRVEKGSDSDQTLKFVQKEFEYFTFHTIEYKLLPTSRKINTTSDISVKRYCSNCGSKSKSSFKFCPNCGNKA